MGLNAEEQAALKKLQEKAKQPDAPAPSVRFNLDLSSDAAWERAKKLGIVSDDDTDDSEDDPDADADDTPRRRSYFGD